jgi:hypothetical protein
MLLERSDDTDDDEQRVEAAPSPSVERDCDEVMCEGSARWPSVERFYADYYWSWDEIKKGARGEPPPEREVVVAPPEPPSPWSWRFTRIERERVTQHLRISPYRAQASEIVRALEGWAINWRVLAADEAERQASRAQASAMLKAIYRSEGRRREGRPGARSTRDLHDRDFVHMALRIMASESVTIARGRDKQGWLEDLLKELCDIAGVKHPNIGDALKAAAKAQQDGPRRGRRIFISY